LGAFSAKILFIIHSIEGVQDSDMFSFFLRIAKNVWTKVKLTVRLYDFRRRWLGIFAFF
jgi:hypothetical protein